MKTSTSSKKSTGAKIQPSNKISPCLWFDGRAEEAAKFYTSLFKNSKIISEMRHTEAGPGPEGSILAVTFELEGQEFMALNGGPEYQFTPAISFYIHCDTQAEIDEFWKKLLKGGKKSRCGWLTDKFGVSWQVVPTALGDMLTDKDAKKSARVMEALLKMDKLILARLQKAYRG